MQPYIPNIPTLSLTKPTVPFLGKKPIRRVRTEEGKGKFQCPKCLRKCQSQHALDNHVRVHTGEKPFPCLVPGCNKFFKQKSQQYSHMRNAHNYNTDLLKSAGNGGPIYLQKNS